MADRWVRPSPAAVEFDVSERALLCFLARLVALLFAEIVSGKSVQAKRVEIALNGNGLRPGIWNCDITDSRKGRSPQWGV